MFFSTVEAFSLYWLIMTLFRYKAQHYAWQALYVILLINLQSYILRNEFELANYVPLICMLIYILLFKFIVKIPLIWSFIATVLGYGIFVFIQTLLIRYMFGSIQELQAQVWNGYLFQTVSACVALLLSWILYKTGLGFKFDFEKMKLNFENVIVIFITILFLLLVSIVFYYNKYTINILFFAAISFFLLYYAIKKERK